MPTIKYFDGKKIVEVKVTQEVASGYQEIRRTDWRIKKAQSRHECSLGFEIADDSNPSSLLDEIVIKQERQAKIEQLKQALPNLSPSQKELIYLKFHKNYSDTEIAKVLGVTRQAVQNRLKKIFEKLKKYF